jgi:hypothetical protein
MVDMSLDKSLDLPAIRPLQDTEIPDVKRLSEMGRVRR